MQLRPSEIIKRLVRTSPDVVIKKVFSVLKGQTTDVCKRQCDRMYATYSDFKDCHTGELNSYFKPLSLGRFKNSVLDHYLKHNFDLLGSGWVNVKHGTKCEGVEGYKYDMSSPVKVDAEGQWLKGRVNKSNLSESKSIWKTIRNNSYVPIDWHLDFKSGFRWSESTWYHDVSYGHKMGVDVKVPWELARMQHLPVFALAYGMNPNLKIYADEFRNQILDFIATNPPRFGVNWRCTMDVAIRAANWLVAYDLLKAYGVQFDSEFKTIFKRSVYDHGLHVINNLEWHCDLRSNHYLSDIVGLIFVAAYLPSMSETDDWLSFGIKELVKEVQSQFYEDGTNFEGSTSYHRLSSELVVYATALVCRLAKEGRIANLPFPSWYFERLEKMAEFTMNITKPNGQVPQIGDNDSGRFIKLRPVKDCLDHRHLVASINGLFKRDDFYKFTGNDFPETYLVSQLVDDMSFNSHKKLENHTNSKVVELNGDWISLNKEFKKAVYKKLSVFRIKIPCGSLDDLMLLAYPDFGLYLYRSKSFYLAVRCGSVGQYGNGGHAHNDQLSIELNINGEDWICDPGTYLYTPLPEARNKYRSVKAHFAPWVEGSEPGRLDAGLFYLGDKAKAKCLYFGKNGFIGVHYGYKNPVYRIIKLDGDELCITDCTEGDINSEVVRKVVRTHLNALKETPVSAGYGIRDVTKPVISEICYKNITHEDIIFN